MDKYEVIIAPLSDEDGGGYLAIVPDLYGCFSDGETPVEAAESIGGAIVEWIASNKAAGREIPSPGWARGMARDEDERIVKLIEEQQDLIETLTSRLRALETMPREIVGGQMSPKHWHSVGIKTTGQLIPILKKSGKLSKTKLTA